MSLSKRTRIKLGIGAFAVAIFGIVIASFSLPVFAANEPDINTVVEKAVLYGVYETCYANNFMWKEFPLYKYGNFYNISYYNYDITSTYIDTAPLPTGLEDKQDFDCSELIKKADIKNKIPRDESLYNLDKLAVFLEGMGYTITEKNSDKQCAVYNYTYKTSTDDIPSVYRIAMCADVEGDVISNNGPSSMTVYYTVDDEPIQFEIKHEGWLNNKNNNIVAVQLDCNTSWGGYGGCDKHEFKKGGSFDEFIGSITNDIAENGKTGNYKFVDIAKWPSSKVAATVSIDNYATAGNKAIKYLSDGAYSSVENLRLNEKEQLALLQWYLANVYHINNDGGCNITESEQSTATINGFHKVYTNLFVNSINAVTKTNDDGYQVCWVKPADEGLRDQRVILWGKNGYFGEKLWEENGYFSRREENFDGVIKMLNDLVQRLLDEKRLIHQNVSTIAPGEGTTLGGTVNDDGDDGSSTPCLSAGQSLGWIICPVASLVDVAIDGIYGMIESDFLQMKPDHITSTKEAWEKFRTYANIAFAIILTIIILSQITGFGVTNYGIKKMLPTIIVLAVLVNISFFICEIAVDLSNIVGYSVRQILANISVGETNTDYSLGGIAHGVAALFLTGGATGAAAVIAATNIELWIMPFLLMLLTAFISILVFFITLGVRQAGIVILVALSPIAIICYALPNTRKMFDRWWKLFFSLLLVYPICGLLMGGGEFASKLLLKVNVEGETKNFAFAFVAVLLQAVPFFFIPSLLRSSMSALGNLGTRLSRFGSGLSRATTGAIRGSEAYKDRQQRLRGANAQRRLRRQERLENFAQSHRRLGAPLRIGSRIRSGNGRLAEMANNSYNRRQARLINAVAARNLANQNAATITGKGLEGAANRQHEELRKSLASTFEGDQTFMGDLDEQERRYEAAIDAVDKAPTDATKIAEMRALQDVMSKNSKGQDRIQRVINRRLADEQASATAEGRAASLSDGMKTAATTLVNDHGGFKNANRALASTLEDMKKQDPTVFNNGKFEKIRTVKNDKGEDVDIYGNGYYDAKTSNASAVELASMNDDAYDNTLANIDSMSYDQLANIYRNASDAITNNNIAVKPEDEGRLNNIRQAAYERMQTMSSGSSDIYDASGRKYKHVSGNNYQYTDATGTVHSYTKNTTTGALEEVGGSGAVVDKSSQISAKDHFASNHGSSYRELHAGDELKLNHGPTRKKVNLPSGWTRNASGVWVDISTGRALNPGEIARAEQIERHNIQVDIDNAP